MSSPKKRPAKRVSRSIGFEPAHMEYLKMRAKKTRRTVNWLVNEMVRNEHNGAASAAAGSLPS